MHCPSQRNPLHRLEVDEVMTESCFHSRGSCAFLRLNFGKALFPAFLVSYALSASDQHILKITRIEVCKLVSDPSIGHVCWLMTVAILGPLPTMTTSDLAWYALSRKSRICLWHAFCKPLAFGSPAIGALHSLTWYMRDLGACWASLVFLYLERSENNSPRPHRRSAFNRTSAES